MSIATQEKIADLVQNARQFVNEAVDKVRDKCFPIFLSKSHYGIVFVYRKH